MARIANSLANLLADLRANAEGMEIREPDGSIWRPVYLDNVRPDFVSKYRFRTMLAQLARMGVYRVLDGDTFGEVQTLAPRK
jgi:hypothetical protein